MVRCVGRAVILAHARSSWLTCGISRERANARKPRVIERGTNRTNGWKEYRAALHGYDRTAEQTLCWNVTERNDEQRYRLGYDRTRAFVGEPRKLTIVYCRLTLCHMV